LLQKIKSIKDSLSLSVPCFIFLLLE
jgi:hypothetical protein